MLFAHGTLRGHTHRGLRVLATTGVCFAVLGFGVGQRGRATTANSDPFAGRGFGLRQGALARRVGGGAATTTRAGAARKRALHEQKWAGSLPAGMGGFSPVALSTHCRPLDTTTPCAHCLLQPLLRAAWFCGFAGCASAVCASGQRQPASSLFPVCFQPASGLPPACLQPASSPGDSCAWVHPPGDSRAWVHPPAPPGDSRAWGYVGVPPGGVASKKTRSFKKTKLQQKQWDCFF